MALPLSENTKISEDDLKTIADIDMEAIKSANIEAKKDKDTNIKAPSVALCPRCGWNVNNKDVVTATTADKQQFLRCTMTNQPFTKTFSLLDDNLVVKLRSRTTAETDMIVKQLDLDRLKGITANNPAVYMSNMLRYQLVTCMELVKNSDGEVLYSREMLTEANKTTDAENNTQLVYENKFLANKFNDILYGALLSAQKDFEMLVGSLTSKVLDPNFWKASGQN